MKRQKDTSTSLSASSSLRTGQARRRTTNQILSKLDSIETLLKKKDDNPLTFKEACAYLGYAPSYLYKLTYRKVIPHYKPTGKIIFFSKNELDEWIYKNGNRETGEVKSETELNGGSTSLNTVDPNQIEMELGMEDEKRKTEENEVMIEFPLKSRRKK